MRLLRVVLASSVALSVAISGCVSAENPVIPEVDGSFDFDAAGIDVAGFDVNPNQPPPDAGVDSTVQDSAPDTTLEDTSVPDTNVEDTSTADVAEDAADANEAVDAAPDVYDAGPGVIDAGPDVVDSGPDVFDAGVDVDAGPPQCASNLFGTYYTRPDGTVVEMLTKNVVVVAATGQPLSGVTQVFDNIYGGCAVRAVDQTVWCWASFGSGNNNAGQLGNGTFTDVSQMYQASQVEIAHPDGGAVVYLDQVASIPQGSEGNYVTATCAVRNDKTLWCWGDSTQGALWQGTTGSTNNLAYATQLRASAPDGGADGGPDAGGPITNVDEVSIGYRHICYLSAGKVYCLGDNTGGELGTGDTTGATQPYPVAVTLPSAASFVAAQQDQTCALVGQQVYCWGGATYSSNGNPARQACGANFCDPSPVSVEVALPDGGNSSNPLLGQSSIFVGYGFGCGVSTSGQVSCWGDQTGTPTIVVEAIPFVNKSSGSGVPSGPVAFLSGSGAGGFSNQLIYVTTSGVLVNGGSVVPQVCP